LGSAPRFFRIAQVLAVNAVLVLGFVVGRWTAGTVLALYWYENLASSILIAIRVYVHRRLTNKSGHYVLNTTKTTNKNVTKTTRSVGTLLQGYLLFAVGFTVAHALFIGILIHALSESPSSGGFNRAEFLTGVESISAFLLIGFILDLGSIRRQPFAWIKLITTMMYFRVIVVQFVVVLGTGLAAIFNAPRGAVALFIVLKLGVDLLGADIKEDGVTAMIDEAEERPFDAAARERLLHGI